MWARISGINDNNRNIYCACVILRAPEIFTSIMNERGAAETEYVCICQTRGERFIDDMHDV